MAIISVTHLTFTCSTDQIASRHKFEISLAVPIQEVGGWGRDPFSRNFMKPTQRRKWYLTTGRRFHWMVLDPIPQSLPVHFFGSRPQPPTSPLFPLLPSKHRQYFRYRSALLLVHTTISGSTHQTASRRNCETGDVITSITNYYGVALVSRIDKIISLFCQRVLQKWQYSATETYNFIDPTDRSHPIRHHFHLQVLAVITKTTCSPHSRASRHNSQTNQHYFQCATPLLITTYDDVFQYSTGLITYWSGAMVAHAGLMVMARRGRGRVW